VAEGLAGFYPCYLLWSRIGHYINSIANRTANPLHPYYDFVKYEDPTNSTSLARFQSLINGYFDRVGDNLEVQLSMFKIVEKSINQELMFADGIYKTN
jgi:thiaminase